MGGEGGREGGREGGWVGDRMIDRRRLVHFICGHINKHTDRAFVSRANQDDTAIYRRKVELSTSKEERKERKNDRLNEARWAGVGSAGWKWKLHLSYFLMHFFLLFKKTNITKKLLVDVLSNTVCVREGRGGL